MRKGAGKQPALTNSNNREAHLQSFNFFNSFPVGMKGNVQGAQDMLAAEFSLLKYCNTI